MLGDIYTVYIFSLQIYNINVVIIYNSVDKINIEMITVNLNVHDSPDNQS